MNKSWRHITEHYLPTSSCVVVSGPLTCCFITPQRLQCVFSTNKNILLSDHNTVIKIKLLTLIYHCYIISNLKKPFVVSGCPDLSVIAKGSCSQSHASSCHASFVSFCLEQFPSLSCFEDYGWFIFGASAFFWYFFILRFRLCILSRSTTEVVLCSSHCILGGKAQFRFVPWVIMFTLISSLRRCICWASQL